MDPVSALGITSTCMTLATNAGTLIMRISVFVSQVRSARKDLDAVSRELTSLQLCLSALKDDQQLGILNLPDAMKVQIRQILVNIDLLLNQISDKLIKLSSGKLGRRIQWATMERDEMNKFRSSLESNKTALEIALTIGSISILTKHVQNSTRRNGEVEVLLQRTESISLNTRMIDGKLDVLTNMHKDNSRFDTLAQEIGDLRTHMTNLATTSANTTLTTFSLDSKAYTLSLLQPLQATLPNSEVSALRDLQLKQTSNLPRKVSCDCDDIYKAKQQDLEVHHRRRLAEYELLHQRDMDNLQEREQIIVSYQQQRQQQGAENVKLQTEITSLKTQIEENAKTIGALRTSQKEWETREQTMTAAQQSLETYVTKPQSISIQRKDLPNTNGRLSGISTPKMVQQQQTAVVERTTATHHRILTGHKNWVKCMAFSPDGTKIVSGSCDRSVRIWDVATGVQLLELDVKGEVYDVAFSPRGTIIAAGMGAYVVELWNIESGRCLQRLNYRSRHVFQVAFSPDGDTVTSTALVIWKVATGKQIQQLEGCFDGEDCRTIAFSPDGTTIAAIMEHGTLRILDVTTGRMLQRLNTTFHPFSSMSFSPDSTTIIVTRGWSWFSSHDTDWDGRAEVWNVVTGKRLPQLNFDNLSGFIIAEFWRDGTTIASCRFDGSVDIWDAATGRQLQACFGIPHRTLPIALSPDGTTVAVMSDMSSIRICNIPVQSESSPVSMRQSRPFDRRLLPSDSEIQ